MGKRSDGLRVYKSTGDHWLIRFKGQTLDSCPCCNRSMFTARAARLVADQTFPQPNGELPPEAA